MTRLLKSCFHILQSTACISTGFQHAWYSFSDPPKMKVYQEDSILEIFDCANSEFVVREAGDGDSVIGKNSAPVIYMITYL